MNMTVADLISTLEDYDPSATVMIAHQPSWPLAEILGGVAGPQDNEQNQACPEHDGWLIGHPGCDYEPNEDEDEAAAENVVWLVAGGHAYDRSPYAPRWVFEGIDR